MTDKQLQFYKDYLNGKIEDEELKGNMKEYDWDAFFPLPISVNSAYGNSRNGRYAMPNVKQWKSECAFLWNHLKYDGIVEGEPWIEVEYIYSMALYNKNGSKKKIDVFNFEKVLSDFIGDNLKGFEDKLIKIGRVVKIEQREGFEEFVYVKIKEIDT